MDRTLYAFLYAAIGDTWGSGDGSTTFNLPDLSDRYIQGAGVAVLGSGVGSNMQSLDHVHDLTTATGAIGAGAVTYVSATPSATALSAVDSRPLSRVMQWIIKA